MHWCNTIEQIHQNVLRLCSAIKRAQTEMREMCWSCFCCVLPLQVINGMYCDRVLHVWVALRTGFVYSEGTLITFWSGGDCTLAQNCVWLWTSEVTTHYVLHVLVDLQTSTRTGRFITVFVYKSWGQIYWTGQISVRAQSHKKRQWECKVLLTTCKSKYTGGSFPQRPTQYTKSSGN